MRVIYMSSNLSIHDYRFLKKLSRSDHEVFLITHYPDKELPANITGLQGIRIIHYHNPLAFGAGADKYPLLIRKISCWIAFARSFLRLKRDIKRIKPDILHAGWVQADGFLAALSGFRPLLIMPWGCDILRIPYWRRSLFYKTKFVLKKANMFTCDCDYVKNGILKLCDCPKEKIVVFPWGIDLSIFKPDSSGAQIRKGLGWDNNKILLMIRSFQEVYGVEYFLHALPKIIKQDPSVRIILAGDGPLKQMFREIISNYDLDNYVHFAGFIKNEDLPAYFNAADIYVSSSLSDGTSLSLLEAMACGLPVVVTDVPSYFEWITDDKNGYIVPRKSSEHLANKIMQLLNNEVKRKAFGRNNHRIAQNRADWDKNYEKLEGIYSLLCAE